MNSFTDNYWFPGKAGGLFGILHMTKNSALTWWHLRAQTNSVDEPLALRLCACMRACSATQPCLTLCDPMDCSPPGSSVHGTSQVRILEWVTFPPPGDLPDPRSNLHLLHLLHCMWILYHWATKEALPAFGLHFWSKWKDGDFLGQPATAPGREWKQVIHRFCHLPLMPLIFAGKRNHHH